MKPKINIITIGVDELERAFVFYRALFEISDEQIDEALKRIAEQNIKYEARAEGEASQDGDAVIVDFVGKIDGEAFDGGSAEQQAVVLGSNRFIPGFEEQLFGVKAGDEKEQ